LGAALVFTHALLRTPVNPQLMLVVFVPIRVFDAMLFTEASGPRASER
jgi:hypothetical protein